MARRAKPRIDGQRVERRLEALKGELDTDAMEGIDLVFATDLLREYAGITEMSISCREAIERDGILIETTTGAKDNRKVRQSENPAFGTYYKCLARMGDIASKTSRFMKQATAKIAEEEEELDEFDRFNA